MNNKTIIKYFKKIIKTDGTMDNTFRLLKYGIYVDGPVDDDTFRLVRSIYAINLQAANSTFYKSFETVEKLTEDERQFLQLIHYASTYGNLTELKNDGHVFVPEFIDLENLPLVGEKFTIIRTASKEEILDDIKEFLISGIAIENDDVDDLVSFIQENYSRETIKELVCLSENKQIKIKLATESNIPLVNVDLFMEQINLVINGETRTFIKSKHITTSMFSRNRLEKIDHLFKAYIDTYGEVNLIQSFRRYKKFLLSIRKAAVDYKISTLSHKINKISRKNKKNNKSKKTTVPINENMSLDEIQKLVKTMNIFQLVKMYNVLSERVSISDDFVQLYKIRNGKVYLKEQKPYKDIDKIGYIIFRHQIEKELKRRYEGKLNKYKFEMPENLILAMPTSLKNTLDNIPDFSQVIVPENEELKIGTFWEDNIDIDLHADTGDGKHIGFYSSLVDEGLTHSGDMTETNEYGFAAEYIKISNDAESPIAFVDTLYSDHYEYKPEYKFKFVIAKNTQEVRPLNEEEIIFIKNLKIDENSKRTLSLGIYDPERRFFIFNSNKQSTGCVPDEEINRRSLEPVIRKAKSALTLNQFLEIIGHKPEEDAEEIKLDNFDVVEFISLLK